MAADSQYMYRFQVLSIADLGHAHRHAAMLQTYTRPDAATLGYRAPPGVIPDLVRDLENFNNRYRTQWQTAAGANSESMKFRRDLVELGMSDVIEKEKSAIQRLQASIRSLRDERDNLVATDEIRVQAPQIRYAIGDLLDINIQYAEIANKQVLKRTRRSQFVLL